MCTLVFFNLLLILSLFALVKNFPLKCMRSEISNVLTAVAQRGGGGRGYMSPLRKPQNTTSKFKWVLYYSAEHWSGPAPLKQIPGCTQLSYNPKISGWFFKYFSKNSRKRLRSKVSILSSTCITRKDWSLISTEFNLIFHFFFFFFF